MTKPHDRSPGENRDELDALLAAHHAGPAAQVMAALHIEAGLKMIDNKLGNMKCPARKALDQLDEQELARLYDRIETLETVAESNKRAYKLVVLDTWAMEERAEQAEAKAAAMTAAMESTAADALKHRGCHRDLMGQVLRAEKSETLLARVRTELHAIDRDIDRLDDGMGGFDDGARDAVARIRVVLDEEGVSDSGR